MSVPRLLVFDLDGTLIDSSVDLCNSVNAALAHVGRAALPDEVIASYIGDGAAALVQRALGGGQASGSLFQQTFDYFLDWYREHKLDHTLPYPGVLAALETIRLRHPALPMAVLTNKPVNPSRAICAALGLAPYFFQNYGGNSFATKKPDAAGLLRLIDEAGELGGGTIAPGDVWMIGDSDVDVRTARGCGARALGCAYGLAAEALAAAGPDAMVDSPEDWVAALGL
jgi:phosphoglycolate phosphatase